jgi:triosephosphate isomerase
MSSRKRRPVIAGNWKMNMTPSQAKTFVGELYEKVKGKRGCDIVVCVPAIDIPVVSKVLAGTAVKVGAQNVHFQKSGAYTGEISADMLVDAGVKYVVVGHSERRQYFGETDETVNLRAKAAVEAGLTAIICVGELLSEREAGITSEVVSKQTKLALAGFTEAQMRNVIIAYEPVWAIGTGKTATAAQANEVCGIIRSVIAGLYGKPVARQTIIQYGGSMNAANAAELLSMDNIDGGLIGGASLKADAFATIVAAAQ